MRRGLLDDRVHRRLGRGEPEDGAVDLLDSHAVEPGEPRGVHGLGEDDRHVPQRALAQVRDRVDVDQPAGPDDPDAVGGVLHLVERVRGEEDGAAVGGGLAQERAHLGLEERVEPASSARRGRPAPAGA